MPELVEAEALLAALAETDEVKVIEAQRRRRVDLQTSYGQALQLGKGFAAEETTAAFARAAELARPNENPAARFAAFYAQCIGSFFRGQFLLAQEIAETFLREAEADACATEAGTARRLLGLVLFFQGDLKAARSFYERALADFVPERDGDARRLDGEASGTAILASVVWHLGEVERARLLIQQAIRRARELGHAATLVQVLCWNTYLEIRRDDVAAARLAADALIKLAEEHGMNLYAVTGQVIAYWASGRLVDPEEGATGLRQALQAYMAQGNKIDAPLFHGMLAELEAATRGPDGALTLIDKGLTIGEETGGRFMDPYLHRLRGDILLKRDPADPAPAEDAYRTAIAIAKQQGARSYELLASLSLAKLYQSTGRPAEAHAVLGPALEGFSSTPEMPEITEAQALLAALAEADEVKGAAASRQRRLQLQTRYGQAMMYSRGFASDESKTAFARARTLAAGVGHASERFDAYYGLFVGSYLRGELGLARETAESFLRDAENAGRMTETAVAHRNVGTVRLWQGDFIGAEANLAEALRIYDPERDRDAKFRFGTDGAAGPAGYLPLAIWAMGDVGRARALGEEALARADETAHAPTRAFVYYVISLYQMVRGDPEAVRRIATIPVELGREHGMALYLAWGEVLSYWARARLGDRESGMTGLREALAAYLGQGNKLDAPLFQGRLAELEAEGNDADGALQRIDEALALASETGERWTDALLHRIRGAILLERDPANTAPAEEAFQTAIAVAQAQKARSFELQAALSLAKLYQSTARPADAHAALAPALGGFAPTPEMPEIAEALALLAALDSHSVNIGGGLSAGR
jgi:predicted ATPase